MKNCFLLIVLASAFFCCSNRALAQGKPKVMVKKEFCPPAELLDESEDEENLQISDDGINEPFLKKGMASLSYANVAAKLNNKYTIVKWKYANHHKPEQIDTLMIITDVGNTDRFVYYKKNKSAGKSQPGLISAYIGSKLFTVGGIKVGMAQLMVDRLFNGKVAIDEEQTNYFIKDKAQNNYFRFSFNNGKVQYVVFTGYWD
jgi:hypothetical protein